MSGSPTKSEPRSTEDVGQSAYDLDDVLACVYHFLNFVSKRPIEDADEIGRLVEQFRGNQGKFKDGPMPEFASHPAAVATHPPIRSTELSELLNTVVADPETWLATPSAQFGGRKPGDLLGTEEERKIVDLLHAVDQGSF